MTIATAKKPISFAFGLASFIGMTILSASPSQAAIFNGNFDSGFSGWAEVDPQD
ncbi:MAG: hypothetical protein LH702_01480 [Phormidesmis sp. CAN_BIN44]|nr:hypothetical protein [Phormidesmis sp. CAN_BIN44]